MSTASLPLAFLARTAAGLAAATALSVLLTGCQPEPSPTASPDPSATESASSSSAPATPPATPSPTPSASAQAGDDISLPGACEELYSPAMLASLQQQAPMNDPGVTMTSTQNVEALEVLSSGVPTIRCSWGVPSETGLATNVSIVDTAQSAAIVTALTNAGFACTEADAGTLCTFEQKTVDLDDNIVSLAETHVVRGNAWISTASVDFAPEGYMEDIVATLWG